MQDSRSFDLSETPLGPLSRGLSSGRGDPRSESSDAPISGTSPGAHTSARAESAEQERLWPPPGATPTRRWLGAIEGTLPGPTLVVVGGMHGNEPAGVVAISRVLQELRVRHLALRGRIFGLAGNTRGLAHNVRFLDRDLNRSWVPDKFTRLDAQARSEDSPEDAEQRELLEIFERLDATFDHPLVIMDLHSFSAEGPPFSVTADTLRNRPIAYELRAPIIFGLEECVEGTLLGFLADKGHVAVGFEGGQHEDPRTVENHVAAIWIALVAGGLLSAADVPDLPRHEARLEQACAGLPRAVEIVYRHAITAADNFRMDPGFFNFQAIRKGQRLATDSEGELHASSGGRMLMPLYQGQGEDGFFLTRDLGRAQLSLSEGLRRLKVDKLLGYLPGVEIDARGGGEIRAPGVANRPVLRGALRMLGYRKDTSEAGELRLGRRRQSASRRKGSG